ncbi:anthrone oxygenase family protein [Mucisphaera calidilacus]|uniref:Integral membrane protein n=1 Tax=Mucisphaera calidilacus TaxID=2527982 RepID=A0A518BZY4_9BACT|nr:anthrone oxygenase family protein [Mucisphaera calidilacus]QDU72536.1 hypothetical protein Pan265_24050 [Mucisphaera calidilacus]
MFETLVIVALTGAGLVAGLLFVFSNCVMRSFEEMPEAEGMRAMQIINRRIQNPLFLSIFMGTTLVCLGIIVWAVLEGAAGFVYAVAGAGLYVVGGFGITVFFNVPLNHQLDQASLDSDEGRELWARYRRDWTRWNHVRTLLCVAAVVLLALAL